jgi:hypothetical protein
MMDENGIGLGDAPCASCNTRIERIGLLLDTWEDDGNGGWWWQCVPGQTCPFCGQPLRWYHKANPMQTLLDLPVSAENTVFPEFAETISRQQEGG